MPSAMNAAFMPTTPPPTIITFAAGTPGTPPSRIPRPPSGFSRMNAPAWGAILPAPPPIGEREAAALVLDGLVGDAGGAGVDQPLRERGVGREVEVGEQDVARLEPGDLVGLRLLDLDAQVGLGEHRGGIGDDRRALGDVVLVGDPRPLARARLHVDGVAA